MSEQPSPLTVRLLSFYVFLLVSRVLDISTISWMHIPLFLMVVLVITALGKGGVRYAMSSKISRYFALFTIWVAACYPFSLWRSATQPLVVDSVEFFLVFLVVIEVVKTPEAWRIVSGGYAYGILVAAVYGFLFARLIDGRLALVGGTFGDPNGFALSLLIGAPFLWLKASFASSLQKLFFFGCSAVVFISFAKAGSRGGLLALSSMMLVMFIISNMKQRMMISVLAVIAVIAAAALLPSYLRARYFTIFSPASSSADLDQSSKGQLESDIESSGERRALLEQSIHMTFEHPIFGVGPGVFAFAAWDERKAESGAGGPTLVTHNTYTQISSECGIPGFIFFMGAVFLSVKYTVTDFMYFRRSDPDLAKLARSLLLAFSALLVGIFFLSTAYSHFLALFLAFAAALHNISTQARNQLASGDLPATPGTRAALGMAKLPAQQRPQRKPVRSRVPSYLRSRGIASQTAVQNVSRTSETQVEP